MHIKHLLPIASLIIITGCNTTPLQPDPDINTASNSIPGDPDREDISPPAGEPTGITPPAAETSQDVSSKDTVAYTDIWERINYGLTLDRNLKRRSVRDRLAWYARNQDYLDRVANRARPYIYYIVEEIEKRKMPMELALLPIVESAYHPFAYSPSRASGIWQFIPGTGRIYGLKQNWWYDGRRDIVAATHAALDYLEKLHREFNGDWLLALAAYNTGEKNVERALRRNRNSGKKLDFWSLRLPRETRGYVPALLAVAELVANPEKHQIKWKTIPDEPYFAIVDAGTQLDLALVAELTGLSMDEVYTLNPAYNRWATDPDGPHTLLVPLDKSENLINGLSGLPEQEKVSWKRHVISRGESLGIIALKYHTSVDTLKRINGIRGNLIHTGNSLLIPTSRQPLRNYTLSLDSRRFQGLKKGSGEEYVYTVRRGDTLWDIGRHYGVSITRLCAWNGISSRSYLRPGQKLSLWLSEEGKALASGNSGLKNGLASSKQPAGAENGSSTYVVKSGDSLWLIANRTGKSVSQLRQLNGLEGNEYLMPGQKLVLEKAGDETPAGNAITRVSLDTSADAPTTTINYSVRHGDSLWLIARRFGISITQLKRWNNIANGSVLKPGQVLNLQLGGDRANVINYTVKKGDSLWLISRRFGTTIDQLKRWNNLSGSKYLKPGQKLVLYITEA